MNIIGKRNNHVVIEMSETLKAELLRLSLLIFVLLFLTFSGCTSGNPDVYVKLDIAKTKDIPEISVIEEESPLGIWGTILPLPEGTVEGLKVGSVHRNFENEIIISYSFLSLESTSRTTRFFNFSKEELETECKDIECYKEKTSGINQLEEEKIHFAKFTSLAGNFRRRISGGGQFRNSMDEGYETLLPNGTVIYEKILWISTEKVEILKFRFYILDENIVLGVAIDAPFVVVFKENLISPFFNNNKTLIKMDGDLTDSIYRLCSADTRLKNITEEHVRKTTDACFVETIKKGVSADIKMNLDKKMEQLYVNKESDDKTFLINGGWGMFLPLPEEYDFFNLSGVYLNAKHEIIILYNIDTKAGSFWRIFNLSRGTLEHEYKVKAEQNTQHWIDEKITGYNQVASISISPLVNTPTGEGYSLRSPYEGINALKYGGYEVISPNGDTRYEKIIWISPEKHKYIVDLFSTGFDVKEVNYIHAETKYLEFYKLDEKTILGCLGVWDPQRSIKAFIIFRNDMTSPYFEKNPLMILIDGKRADTVYDDCISYNNNEVYENADKCFVEYLKGEYTWLK